MSSGKIGLFCRKPVKIMTALKREVIQLVEQMPEEQMIYIIRYIHTLRDNNQMGERSSDGEEKATPKMRAFLELEKMLVPVSQDIDYDKALAEARDEKYGYTD